MRKFLHIHLFILTASLVSSLFLVVNPETVFASGASIYVIERADGSVTFTSRKPKTGNFKVLSQSSKKISYSRVQSKKPQWPTLVGKGKYSQIIDVTSVKAGVDPNLVKAVVQVESSFNPNATSNKGAMGLMQLMPQTAKRLGVKDPYKPEDNIKGGVKYLKLLLDRYDGNIGLTLAAYNAGEYAVEKHGGIPPFDETIKYVRKVVELQQQYKVSRG
jgi:soluble lytic murein transglycosylase-like protein